MENNNMGMLVQLNNYPKDKFNVLVPVTTMQVASNLQRITVNTVELDTNKDTSKDIYFDKSANKFAITKVGGMKLAAAANISIVATEPSRTEGCLRCIEMARATGKPRVCGNCEHVHDVAVSVTIRVPEPSGGFRLMKATKEIDCTMEKASMTEAQYKRFLPHRTAMAESKAFMRAIRAALGLAGNYELAELRKPFIVAHVVPNLDAPEIKDAVAQNYLQSMGMLFEMPVQRQTAALPAAAPAQDAQDVPEYDDEAPGSLPWDEAPQEPDDGGWGYDDAPPAKGNNDGWGEPSGGPVICSDCRKPIVESKARNGKTWSPEAIKGFSEKQYGRCLCPACQDKAKGRR